MGNQNKRREQKSREQVSHERGQALKSNRRASLNKRANEAASKAKLSQQERQDFHRYLTSLSDDELNYHDLVALAKHFKH